MSGPVIIRLQNLPLEARSIDIRRFFEGCVIPDGGVHIIGGANGDAFIAFQSDEDARLAMGRDMRPLCGAMIKLFLSSKTEMQNVIVSARQAQAPVVQPPKTNPLDFLSKYVSNSNPPTFQPTPPKPEVNLINQLTSSINPNILDQLKSINQLLPGLQSAATIAPAPKPAEPAAKTNISIDQILGILQTHLQPQSTAAIKTQEPIKPVQKDPTPEPENSYNNRYNNSNRFNANDRYNTDKSGGYGDRNGGSYNGNGYNDKYNSNNNNNNGNINNKGYNNNNNQNQNNVKYDNGLYQNKRKYEDEPGGYGNNKNYHETKYSNNFQSNQNGGLSPQRSTLDPIIRVKNFNNNCSYKDVRTFLQGIQIEHDGIKLLTDNNGQRNGSAFVKLLSITDLKKALCRNKQYYEDRTIIVTQSAEHEFDTAKNVYSFAVTGQVRPAGVETDPKKTLRKDTPNNTSNSELNSESGFYLKIYGLPVKFDENDLKSMFNNVNFLKMTTATPTPITSTNMNNGQSETVTSLKAKKICEVETQLDLERALTRQDEQVGKSKLKIYQINKQEYDRELTHALKYSNRGETTTVKSGSSVLDEVWSNDDVFVYVSNIPSVGREVEDLKEFFEDINIIAIIPIDSYPQKPAGEAVCYFATKSERDSALQKDGQQLKARSIQVQSITYTIYLQHVQKYIEILKSNENLSNRRVLLGDSPTLQITNLFSPNSNGSTNYSPENEFNNKNNNNNRIYNTNNSNKIDSMSPQALPPLPEEFQRYRNKLILLSNIAYDASREDILSLVANFSPIEHTLKIRHDDQGRPAGDAVIAFQNPEDANQAVSELDGYMFMGDHVRATLFSNA